MGLNTRDSNTNCFRMIIEGEHLPCDHYRKFPRGKDRALFVVAQNVP